MLLQNLLKKSEILKVKLTHTNMPNSTSQQRILNMFARLARNSDQLSPTSHSADLKPGMIRAIIF